MTASATYVQKCKGNAARTELCEHHCKQAFGYHTAWEYPYKYIERACQIIADYAHKLARQISAPRVHKALAVAYYVMHIVEIETYCALRSSDSTDLPPNGYIPNDI